MSLEERVAAGEVFESPEEVTDEYKELLTGLIEFTANSEFMGAYTERQWIPKAPSYQRKLALTAKLQDEVGHAQMQYRLCESLGRDREEMLDDLLSGNAGFGNAFHYPADEWLDIAMIAWLIDGAAMQLQHSLQRTSYGPYNRVMRRVCREEEFHLRHGEHIVGEYATGSKAQREKLQEAIDRWWPRGIMFYGFSDSKSGKQERMKELNIKPLTNDELRQKYLDVFVPKIRKFGMEVPDPNLSYDEDADQWHFTDPDWDEFTEILRGNGPVTQARVGARQEAFEDSEWVREALAAHHGQVQGRFSNGPQVAGD